MAKYLTGRSKRTPQSGLTSDRYLYLSVNQAEPNLGDPTTGISSIGFKTPPPGQQYQIVSVASSNGNASYPGERYWVPISGGLIPGSISVYEENSLVGSANSINQLKFVGNSVTASAVALDVVATITFAPPGNNGSVLFKESGDFATSSGLVFNSSVGILTVGTGLVVGTGGTFLNVKPSGLIGIGTTNPTQKLDINGDLRLTGTIYDYYNLAGASGQLLVKNSLGGIQWTSPGTIRAGAGGTITNIQYHSATGLVEGASNFVFDPSTSRVGIGSTLPVYLLDVLGYSRFKGQTEIDNLKVTGVTTVGFATITNSYLGVTTIGYANITNSNLGITTVGFITATNAYIGVGTVGFATITNSYLGVTTVGLITAQYGYVGILTVTEINIDRTNLTNLNVTGIATIATLGVTGVTTTRNLNVIGITTTNSLNVAGFTTTTNLNVSGIATVNNLNVTGVGTFGNVKISGATIDTNSGNLYLNSFAGLTQIDDVVYVTDISESNSKDTGSIVTDGGVGIEKNLNVGGKLSVTGIITTSTDLYVGGDLYVKDDIFYDELFARNGNFTGVTTTRDLIVTGIATIATLGVTGLTTTRNLKVIGISTFDNYIDANGGAYIDNIQIGISGDNTIDTTTGGLTIDSAGGTTTVNDNLTVSGTSTLNGNVIFGDATSDTVSFTSRVDTAITPSTNGTLNLGGISNKWNNIYANTFVGAITGNADTATTLQTARSIAATNDITWSVVFDGSTNVSSGATLKDSGVTAGTYGSSTQVGIVTVDNKGRVTAASNIPIAFAAANVSKADSLTTSRNFSITGDTTAPAVSFNGTADVALNTTLVTLTPSPAGTYGSSSTVGIVTVDNKGRVTAASNVGINFSTQTVAQADRLTNTRNIAITGDLAWNVNFNGSADVTGIGTLKDSGVVANTYGSATIIPVFDVDIKGRVTSVTNTSINFSSQTVSKADSLTTSRNFSITGDTTAPAVSFNGTANVDLVTTLATLTPSPAGTYGSSSTVGIVTVDNKGRVTAASNVGINFSAATVLQANQLTNGRNFSITGEVTASAISFNGTADVALNASLASLTPSPAGTYGDTITIPRITVDSKGRVTSVTTQGVNFSTQTVAQADKIKTVSSTAALLYPTFVANNNSSAGYESVYTDLDISYNANTNTLTIPKIKPTQILDTSGGTGTENFVLTANGTGGGWSWKSVTGGGSPAIAGITIQEEGTLVGSALGTQILNFIGGSVTATSGGAGVANISITATSDIYVNQTGYGCVNPITVTNSAGISSISIGTTSNAYGTRYVQSTQPASACDGDIWYDTSGGTTGGTTPAGTVIYFANTSAPTGYIKANGATTLNTYAYRDLHKAIGNTFGGTAYNAGVTDQPAATTVFTIPDLRGQFIRSWADDGTTYDVLRPFGQTQADDFKSHTHTSRADNNNQNGTAGIAGGDGGGFSGFFSGRIGSTGGTETRPRNIALLACIKY